MEDYYSPTRESNTDTQFLRFNDVGYRPPSIIVCTIGRRWAWTACNADGRRLAGESGEFSSKIESEIAVRFVRIKAQAWQFENNARGAAIVEEVAS